MKMSTYYHFLNLIVSVLLIVCCTRTASQQLNKHVGVALFIFGDSLFDSGNNNYINTTTDFQANFWPYGETFFNYPTGRFSDGRVIPDLIAEYANLPPIPTYLQPDNNHQYIHGANFASGGAGALRETHSGKVIPLETQLGYFKNVEELLRRKLGEKRSEALLCNGVYFFNIGNNEYLSLSATNSSILYSSSHGMEYVDMVISNITSVIKEIYEMGGRKFGFLSSPRLGCIPGVKAMTPEQDGRCMEQVSNLAKLHNKVSRKGRVHAVERVLSME